MSKATMPAVPPLVSTGSSPANHPQTTREVPGTPSAHTTNTTRTQSRDGLRASVAQPGLADTPEAIEAGLRHAKMEVSFAASVKPMPMPGTMAFNDAQTQHWAAHTRLPDTPAVAKARMLATIAQDQADAGIEFKGQIKPAEAQRLLAEAERAQASQAALASNPIGTVVQMAQDSLEWLSSRLFGGEDPSADAVEGIHALSLSDVTAALENAFVVVKSPALVALEKQDAQARHIVFAMIEDNHYDASTLGGFKTLLREAFDAKGGDYLLIEMLKFDESGRQTFAQENNFSCYGIPHAHYENCEYLKETAPSGRIVLEQAALVKRARATWDELVQALPTDTAEMARREYQVERQKVTRGNELDISKFVSLIGKYTRLYTRAAEHADLRARVNTLADDYNGWVDEAQPVSAGRTIAYWTEIGNKIQNIRGNLFTLLGASHGPEVAVRKGYNKLSDFKGDEIPAYYLSMKKNPVGKKEL